MKAVVVEFLRWLLAALWNALLDALSAAVNAEWSGTVGGSMAHA